MAEHDHSYKLLFSHQQMVADLLRGFVHEPWVSQVDLATLEHVPGSYVSLDLREREDDIIWRLHCGDEWLYIYILLEFQSTVEEFMAVRIMTYEGLLYEDLIRNGVVASGQLLPPVFPIVLYNGERRWTAARDIGDLIHPAPEGLGAYRPQLRYLLLAENEYRGAQAAPLGNLVAQLFQLENARTPEQARQAVDALVPALRSPELDGLRQAFTVWLQRVMLPRRMPGVAIPEVHDLLEVRAMLAERVREWTREWWEGGLQQGARDAILEVLEMRFEQVPADAAVAIDAIDDRERLKELHRAAIAATSLDEFMAKLNAG